MKPLAFFGAAGSGSVAVEAALTLLDIPFELVEGATWARAEARERVAQRVDDDARLEELWRRRFADE